MTDLKNRSRAIDAGRGVAILAVMAYHYFVRWAPPFSRVDLYGYQLRYPPILEIGRYGVHVFFVISGLVITMTMLRSQDVADFALRRFARLYPAFIAAALLTFGLMRLAGPPLFQVGVTDLAANLPMIADDLGRRFVDGAYWSLSVEVKFYALVALSFLLLRNRFWIALIAFGLLGTAASHVSPLAARLLVAQFMPLFLLGMAAWYAIQERDWRVASWIGAAACGLYGLNAGSIGRILGLWWPPHVFILGVSGLMLALFALNVDRGLGPLAGIGRISYSLYLVHQRIGVVLIGRLKSLHVPDAFAIAAAFAVSIGLAAAMFYWLERPAQRAILRLWRSRANVSRA
jgi:peptidoglycan/LPS O-acetylase OafA/YrhL